MKTFYILCLITAVMIPGRAYAQSPSIPEDQAAIESARPLPQDVSEQSLWCIMCAAPGGIGTLKSGVIVMVNDYICRLLGYSREELLGKNVRMLYPDEHEYDLVNIRQKKQASLNKASSVETRWRTKAGSIRDVHLFSAPLDADNPSAGIVFTVQDITPRKQADRSFGQRMRDIHAGAIAVGIVFFLLLLFLGKKMIAIKRSEQELTTYKEALDNATDAIGMSTPEGRHYYQNRALMCSLAAA